MYIDVNDVKLFLNGESNFNHNKYVLDEATSCMVTETTDGIFDLDLEFPLNDTKKISGLLVRENIIKSPISQTDSRGDQLFTIRKRSMNTKDNRITIYAQAKARRDLDMNMILGLEVPAGQTRKQACQQLLSKCVLQQGYSIGNMDTSTNTSVNLGLEEDTGNVINYLDISGTSALKGFLSDSENSIFKAYGGEIVYNNFEINMVDERGTDHNILIESEKNLEELQQDIDDTDTENFATAILPCSSDGVYLPNSEIIYSPNAQTLGVIFKKVVYDDVTLVENTQEAFNVVYDQLRERVQKDFNNGLDKLKVTNTIKYVQLKNTEEYKPYAKLFTEKCEIGNNVTVRYYMRNDKTKYIDAVGRVVKIKFNVLKNRIEEIEIGDRKKKSILDTITNAATNVSNVNQKANDNKADIKKKVKEAKDYTDNREKSVRSDFTVADDAITADIKDYKTGMETTLSAMNGEILARVTSETYDTEIHALNGAIESKVEKNDFGKLTGSYIKQNYDSITEAIEDATGSHTCTFSGSGLTVQNGGFKVEDSSGDIALNFSSQGIAKLKDLQLDSYALEKGSYFYNALANMDEVSLSTLKIQSRFVCDSDDFYINNGYTLEHYIKHVMGVD